MLAATAWAWLRSTSVLSSGESMFLVMGKASARNTKGFHEGRERWAGTGSLRCYGEAAPCVALAEGLLESLRLPPAASA